MKSIAFIVALSSFIGGLGHAAVKTESGQVQSFRLERGMDADALHQVYPVLLGPEVLPGPFDDFSRLSDEMLETGAISATRVGDSVALIPEDLRPGSKVALIPLRRGGEAGVHTASAEFIARLLPLKADGTAVHSMVAGAVGKRVFDGMTREAAGDEYSVLFGAAVFKQFTPARVAQFSNYPLDRSAAVSEDRAKEILLKYPHLARPAENGEFHVPDAEAVDAELGRLYRLTGSFSAPTEDSFLSLRAGEEFLLYHFPKARDAKIRNELLQVAQRSFDSEHKDGGLAVALTNHPQSPLTLRWKAHFEALRSLLALARFELAPATSDGASLGRILANLKRRAQDLRSLGETWAADAIEARVAFHGHN